MKCELCENNINNCSGCTEEKKIKFSNYPDMEPVRVGDSEDSSREKCHDCGALSGNIHHMWCDMERCPRCGDQFITCDCVAISG